MGSFKSLINKSYYYRKLAALVHARSVKKDPRMEMKRYYNTVWGIDPNIDNPTDLIEKTYWLLLYTDTSLWTLCADKYRVRDYIKEKGLGDYLPKLLGKWDKASLLDFSSLPKEFILKTNNGCGTCHIVNDKSSVDMKSLKKGLRQDLSIPFGYAGAQLHYLTIEPCIIAEELLHSDEEQNRISPNSLIDYKVWCINGNPESILIVYDRRGHHYCLDLYDTQWNRMMDKMQPCEGCEYREDPIPQPQCLSQMLEMAKLLSKPFQEVRVDFYVVGGKPIIGELTFTTGFGYFTNEYYDYLGSKMDLNKVNRIR